LLRLLPTPVSLGSIDDVERFARDALRRGCRMMKNARLEGDAKLEALDYLIHQLYELWERYDPALNSSFTKYAYPILPCRLADWYRSEFGDSRYAPRPTLDEYNDELGLVVDHSTSVDEVLTTVLFARRLAGGADVALAC
jgi:hypothetical protein